MHISDFEFLLLIPFGLAIAFMIWVFWNLTKQLKQGARRHQR